MKNKILSFILASLLVGVLAGCAGNTDTGANTETNVETTVETNTAEETTVEAVADTSENVEDADKQSEADAEAEKEKERIETLREDIAGIIENDIPGLIAEMEANGNTEGIDALNAFADKYSAEYDDTEADNFKPEYDAILEAKETYDKEYAAEQERIAAEKKAAEEEAAKKEAEIPDWFDATYYANNNPDVVAAVGNSKTALYDHYKNHGKSEGRAAYAGDPNAKAQVADSGNTGGNTTNSNEINKDWWKSLPRNEWVDMGTFFICIGEYPTNGLEFIPIVQERTGRNACCGSGDCTKLGYPSNPSEPWLTCHPYGNQIN
ncbi:MAG: hypothetical protein IJ691_06510 [Lachnospiraceae bacterium]|nr:hypothetical protein [Lachnospiraceae bacterium]